MFGAGGVSSPGPTTSGFAGFPPAAAAATRGGFGFSYHSPSPTPFRSDCGGFDGSSTASTTSGFGGFGSSPPAAAAATRGGFGFGANSASQSQFRSAFAGFGTAAPAAAAGARGGGFGGTTRGRASGFGAGAAAAGPAAPTTPKPAATNASPVFGGFSAPAATPSPTGFGFGAAAASPSPAGANAALTPFNAAAATFGSSAAATLNGSGTPAAAATPPSTGFGFGVAAASPAATPASPARSAFAAAPADVQTSLPPQHDGDEGMITVAHLRLFFNQLKRLLQPETSLPPCVVSALEDLLSVAEDRPVTLPFDETRSGFRSQPALLSKAVLTGVFDRMVFRQELSSCHKVELSLIAHCVLHTHLFAGAPGFRQHPAKRVEQFVKQYVSVTGTWGAGLSDELLSMSRNTARYGAHLVSLDSLTSEGASAESTVFSNLHRCSPMPLVVCVRTPDDRIAADLTARAVQLLIDIFNNPKSRDMFSELHVLPCTATAGLLAGVIAANPKYLEHLVVVSSVPRTAAVPMFDPTRVCSDAYLDSLAQEVEATAASAILPFSTARWSFWDSVLTIPAAFATADVRGKAEGQKTAALLRMTVLCPAAQEVDRNVPFLFARFAQAGCCPGVTINDQQYTLSMGFGAWHPAEAAVASAELPVFLLGPCGERFFCAGDKARKYCGAIAQLFTGDNDATDVSASASRGAAKRPDREFLPMTPDEPVGASVVRVAAHFISALITDEDHAEATADVTPLTANALHAFYPRRHQVGMMVGNTTKRLWFASQLLSVAVFLDAPALKRMVLSFVLDEIDSGRWVSTVA